MGGRNLNRVSVEEWHDAAPTVAAMKARGWEVYAVCSMCRRSTEVNLAIVVRKLGPTTTLWNRKQRCPMKRCSGAVEFEGVPPGYNGRLKLTLPPYSLRNPNLDERLLASLAKGSRDLRIWCNFCRRPERRLNCGDTIRRYGWEMSFGRLRLRLRSKCRYASCGLNVEPHGGHDRGLSE